MEVMRRMEKIFQIVFEDETLQINESVCAEDIENWDSLHHVTLLSTLEKEFHIKFDIDEIITMENVGDMFTIIKNKINV